LNLGASTTEANFSEYKIFYKIGTVGVTESDLAQTSANDPNLGVKNFNGATTTKITGLSSGTNYVLTSTNIALPRSQWKAIATNVFSASGNTVITLTNGVNRSVRQKFYIIQTP